MCKQSTFIWPLLCSQGKRREGSEKAVFYVSFLAGNVAGSVASLAVNPFDGENSHCVSSSKLSTVALITELSKRNLNSLASF